MLSPVSLPLVTSPSPRHHSGPVRPCLCQPRGAPCVFTPRPWHAAADGPGQPGLSCVWKCQKFDGLRANEAKLGWSLCMPSTMLTRVLTPDPVTTMSELKLEPPPPHYGLCCLLTCLALGITWSSHNAADNVWSYTHLILRYLFMAVERSR